MMHCTTWNAQASWSSRQVVCSNFQLDFPIFDHSNHPYLSHSLEGFPMLDFVKFGVLRNPVTSSTQRHWVCMIWSPEQRVMASESGILRMTFQNVQLSNHLLTKLEMLLVNLDNQLIGKLAKFNKVFAFRVTLAYVREDCSMISFYFQFSSNLICICRFSCLQLMAFPMSDFDGICISGKLVMS